ncbi:MAG: sialate O-acetylesterase [Bacilli bacterium]|jgi:hypothetical protein|nr:sialate O-acetylesterase [Bacilli bacterium]
MKIKKSIFLLIISILILGCQNDEPQISSNNLSTTTTESIEVVENEAQMVLLFGQSNMVGYTRFSYLSTNMPDKVEEYTTGYEDVKINFNLGGGNTSNNEFVPVKLGQGRTEESFGPEIGIAETLTKGNKKNVFLVKYAVGGTSLSSQWVSPTSMPLTQPEGGTLYKGAVEFTFSCIQQLEAQGYNPRIRAICWMQGESDANGSQYDYYYTLTQNFISDLRLAFDEYKINQGIGFVDAAIAAISKWREHEAINDAKRQNAEEDPLTYFIDTNAELLTTDQEPANNPDLAHYDSVSMVKLGRLFGLSLVENFIS